MLTPEQVESQILGLTIASDYGYIQGTGDIWCRKTVAMPAGFTNSNCRVVVSPIGYKAGVPASIRDYGDLELLTCAKINSAANSVTITLARSSGTISTAWYCGYTLLYIKTA